MRLAAVAVLAGLVTSLTAAPVVAADAPASSSETAVVEPPPSPPLAQDPPRPWLATPPQAKPVALAEPTRSPWRSALLLLVVAALGGAAIYAKRSKRVAGKFPQSARLRVMSSVRVGPKGFLVLAGIGERTLLLGVTDDSVRRIAWMANEPVDDRAKSPAHDTTASLAAAVAPDFAPALRLAAESHDEVRWSPEAKTARQPALATARTQPDLGASSLSFEQQAAGIMKRKARRRV
jgi:flagellar biogenesis protein FliO